MGRYVLFYVWMDGWVRALGLGGYDIHGRKEWRKLVFILRIYKWNFSSVFMFVSFFFWFFFSSFFGHL